MGKYRRNTLILILIIAFVVSIGFNIYLCFRQYNFTVAKKIGYHIEKELAYDEIENYFGFWDNDEEKSRLSKFLEYNDLVILPGEYRIRQAVAFEDIMLILRFGDRE